MDEQATEVANDAAVKRTKHRSPNYPVMGLRKAMERAKDLYTEYKRGVVPINLTQTLWGYKEHSGAGNQAVAAVKSYGLIEVDGDGKNRRVHLSDLAYRVLMNSADRSDLLKKAAISPQLYAELWSKYKGDDLPHDDLIKHYLLFDREDGTFNADTVDSFIANFRDTLRFANLLPNGTLEPEVPNDPATKASSVTAGDHVQWTNGGMDMFDTPRLVRGVSDDGQWAFVEGTETGVLISELTIMNPQNESKSAPALPKPSMLAPPPNPFKKEGGESSALPPTRPGSVQEQKVLDEGTALMQWPDNLSKDSVADLEYWLQGVIRRLRRKAGLPLD